MLTKDLVSKKYESHVSIIKELYYRIERWLGNFFFRRAPPKNSDIKLLNLGCGPLRYPGFCNADDYAFKRSLVDPNYRPDWRLDITKSWKCDNDYWHGIFSQHVVEHLTYSEAIFMFRECLRTLVPGAWLRVSVPSLNKYIDYYNNADVSDEFKKFPCKALAFSFFSQMHFHKSIWDNELIIRVLTDTGYCNVKEAVYMQGSDVRLLKDQECKAWESLYVEAQKPNP